MISPNSVTQNVLPFSVVAGPLGLTAFGDSNCVGTGSTTDPGGIYYTPANTQAWESKLAAVVQGANHNGCIGGSQTADAVTVEMFGSHYLPAASDNPVLVEAPGTNEVLHCDNVSGNMQGCHLNAAYAQRTLDVWTSTTNRTLARNCTSTNFVPDVRLPDYAVASSTTGSTFSCLITVPSTASGACFLWEALDGNQGTAQLSLDGTVVDQLQAYGFNGQSVRTDFLGTTWTVHTQCYAAAPGTHTFSGVVTSPTGPAYTFAPVAALSPMDASNPAYGSPRTMSSGVIYLQNDLESANTAFYEQSEAIHRDYACRTSAFLSSS